MDGLSSHSVYVLQQLQEQRIQGLLCDCTLVVKGVCFKAHKNVLAAFSAYFRSLFQNSPGQRNDVFHLSIQDVGGIGQVLDYMYTSHLELNQDNVHTLMEIAQTLQVSNILNMCQVFLKPCVTAADVSFSLPADVTDEQNCVWRNSLSSEADLHKHLFIPADEQNKRPMPALSSTSVEANSTLSQGRQPLHGYKLRNFYTKQYFKQSANQNLGPCLRSAAFAGVQGQIHANTTIQALPTHQTHASCGSLLTDSAHPPKSEPAAPPTTRILRPKKAVYLKKFNYLRSHVSVEECCAEADAHCDQQGAAQTYPTNSNTDTPVEALTSDPADADPAKTVTSDPAEVSQLKMTPAAQTDDAELRHDSEKSEVSSHKYCCEVCGKTFKHPSNLELHKRSHTGEKPFQCHVCSKSFSQAGNLQTHLRRHTGEKPYICELCGKSFAASGDVQRHIMIHSGVRPHLCDVCGRGFSNFSNLKEHKKTHSTEQQFTCDQCGKSFNMQRKLLKHRARHTGDKPHSCQTCGKCFAGSGDLQRHVRSHTGERPYMCDTCGKSFTRTAVLRRHRSSHCTPTDCAGAAAPQSTAAPQEKPQAPTGYAVTLRPPLPSADAPCSLAARNHCSSSSATCRNAEGLCSSGALWGRAMKTLQSDTEMDQ